MEEIEKPNFYAILPADVRYDNRLSAKEKLLYAEITALSNKEGYCWANNTYFANLYNASNRTIITCINNLVDLGYVDRKLIHKKNSKEVEKRLLYPRKEISLPSEENFTTPSEENFTDNNTSINTINEYTIDLSKHNVDNETEFIQIIQEWLEYKKDKKQSYKSEHSLNLFIKKLVKLSDGYSNLAREIVENSIAYNYSGIFELKNKSSCGSSNSQPVYSLNRRDDWNDPEIKKLFEGEYKTYD